VQRSGRAHSLPHIEQGLPMPISFASAGGQPGGGSMPTSTIPASRVPHAGFWPDEQLAAAHRNNAVIAIVLRTMPKTIAFAPSVEIATDA